MEWARVYQRSEPTVNVYTLSMFRPQAFLTRTLKHHARGHSVTRILAAAMNAVEPGAAVKRYLEAHPLLRGERTFAFGLGKAACPMVNSLAHVVDLTNALIITKHASRVDPAAAVVIEGDHPIPGESSLTAGRAAKEFVTRLTPDDLLVCLISGGGSALMAAPLIPLEDLQMMTSALLVCGARIDEINTLRRHLDALKGGGLARAANGARILSLILSDVVGDSIEAIASGPTAPDPSTCEEAIAILRKYDLLEKVPASVYENLRETVKQDDPVFNRVENHIIASNDLALSAAQLQAEQEGFQTTIVNPPLQGEASETGITLATRLLEEARSRNRSFCLLAGGETTVTIKGNGRGGRTQELALGAVEGLSGLDDMMLISIATDGEDGPTDAAGAVVTGETAPRAERLGLSASEHLSRNDAYAFFEPLEDLVRIGPSGTNVNDLVLCFAF
jgi:hydroxypyruvate reductase